MADLYDGEGIRSTSDHCRRLRSLLLLLPKRDSPPLLRPPPKTNFAAAAFRGLGCSTSSSQVHAPSSVSASTAAAAVRSSADWQGKRSRRRKKGKGKKKERVVSQTTPPAVDVWCTPGIGFDGAVDCVAPSFQTHGRGRVGVELERNQREDLYNPGRRGGNSQEQISALLDSPDSSVEVPLFGSDMIPPRHLHRARRIRRSPGGLDEIMIFQARLMLGEMDLHDRYRDWRLDVDNMSYEELLELGDRIGYVNTGLREEEIIRSLRKMKHSIFSASPIQLSSELERKCSICQEDYELNDELGRLDCGHSYHLSCVKQWLLRKNACPVCKATVAKT